MPTTTAILLVGGAPRVPVDAVRHLTVAASGATAVAIAAGLSARGRTCDVLLSLDAAPDFHAAQRYRVRADLDIAVENWVRTHPHGTVVMSAAVNDYETVAVLAERDGRTIKLAVGAKLPSRAEAVQIHLRPVAKLIDRLRSEWGFSGHLVAFKYEEAATVLAAAEQLRQRCDAAAVVANSLCGQVQAVVDADGVIPYPDRRALLDAVIERLASW